MARSPKPAAAWTVFTIATLGALFLAFAALGSGINAGHPAAGETRGGDITAAVICAVLAALLVWVAAVFEHRARHRHAASDPNTQPALTTVPYTTYTAGTSLNEPGGTGGFTGFGDRPRRNFRRTRRRSPGAAVFGSFVVVVMAVVFWIATVGSHNDAEQSQRTQHASSVPAVVESVHVTRHETRSGHYYTTSAPLQLLEPVDGRTTSTLHLRGNGSSLVVSADIVVRLDPKDPGYAEWPGAPYSTTGSWVLMLCMAIFCTTLATFMLFMTVRLIGEHRALRAAPAVA